MRQTGAKLMASPTLITFHRAIQIAFGWSGRRSFLFNIQGHRQQAASVGNPCQVTLSDVRLHSKERFSLDEEDAAGMSRPWRFQIRLEKKLLLDARDAICTALTVRVRQNRGTVPAQLLSRVSAIRSRLHRPSPCGNARWKLEPRALGRTASAPAVDGSSIGSARNQPAATAPGHSYCGGVAVMRVCIQVVRRRRRRPSPRCVSDAQGRPETCSPRYRQAGESHSP